MKTFIHPILFLLAAMALSSCTEDIICVQGSGDSVSQGYVVSTFDQFSLGVSADVKIYKDTIQSITIQAQQNVLNQIDINVINGKLVISRERCFVPYEPVEIIIHVQSLKSVELAGSGNIQGYGTFSATVFNAELSGSGNMEFFIDAGTLDAEITGSGNMQFNGSAENQDLELTGSGNMQLFGLVTDNTDVELTGSGNCEVYAEETLDVEITGSGNVLYKGVPSINVNISGSGNLINAN